ncbi:MAG: Gfo/Idh/MocA family protein, partial [Bacteroidota bacterium]
LIGDVKMISADFGFKASDPPAPRLYEPSLGGGALLDIGIYPVFLALSLLGKPSTVSAVMTPYATGVDEQIAMNLQFASGALASLHASFAADTPVEARINGTKGRIILTPRFHNPITSQVILELPGRAPEILVEPSGHGGGYQYEARHVQECLAAGLTESPLLSLDFSRLLMETLDRLRATCGIHYPADQH